MCRNDRGSHKIIATEELNTPISRKVIAQYA
jgi:hypothetical protein